MLRMGGGSELRIDNSCTSCVEREAELTPLPPHSVVAKAKSSSLLGCRLRSALHVPADLRSQQFARPMN